MTAVAESRQRVVLVCGRIVDSLERNAGIAAAMALILIFVIALGQSADNLLWYNEIVTLKTASLPQWSDVWNFYAHGLDTTGPVPSLIARVGLMLPIGPELGSRLPFTVAYLVMCLCVFGFVHRRYPAGYALATLIFALIQSFFYFATDARAYALVLAGAGVAMLCWQSAVSGRHRPWSLLGLWFGLAFALDAHAFAIFLFVPFALAQFVQDFKHKKPDWPTWAALLLFPAGFLPLLHGQLLAKKIYGTNFSHQPDLQSMFSSYQDFLLGGVIRLIILLLVATGAVLLQRQSRLRFFELKTRGFSLPEWILVATLALLPLYVVPASYRIHAYAPRYVVSCYIGLVILAIGAAAEAARRNRFAGAVLFALLLLSSSFNRIGVFAQGLHALVHPGRVHKQLEARYNGYAWVQFIEQSGLLIVADNPNVYSQVDYYVGSRLEHRLIGITDIRDVKKYPLSGTHQLNFLCFSKPFSYQTADLADFLLEHPHFLLIASRDEYGWLHRYLIDQQEAGNASFACLGPDCAGPDTNVYDVHFMKLP
jgi:hypothetical protein